MPDGPANPSLLEAALAVAPLSTDAETSWSFVRDCGIVAADARDRFLEIVAAEAARGDACEPRLGARVASRATLHSTSKAAMPDPGLRDAAALWDAWRRRRILRLTYVDAPYTPPQDGHGRPLVGGQRLELRFAKERWPYTIGAAGTVDLVVRHPTVGRQVVRLWLESGAMWIVDLHSGGGSRLNDVLRPDHVRVRDGDVLEIGAVRLTVALAPPAE